jgi:hypothetical protein
VVVMALGVVGCSNEVTAPSDSNGAAMMIANPVIEPGTFVEGSLESEVRVVPTAPNAGGTSLDRLVSALNLSDDQKATFRQLLAEYHECLRAAREAHDAAVRRVIAPYAEQRKALAAELRAGTITREEFHAKVREINAAARAALAEAKPKLDELRLAAAWCYRTWVTSVSDMLNDEQKGTFLRWVQNGGFNQNPSRPDRPTPPVDRPVTPERPEKPETPVRPEKPETPERPEKPETPERPEKPETPERPEKPETPERPTPPVRPGRG